MIHIGDVRAILPTLAAESVHCCVTSPPYWGLRNYGAAGQIGLEQTPDTYVAEIVAVMRDVRRVLRNDGTLWLNLGDSYASSSKSAGRNDTKTMYGAASAAQDVLAAKRLQTIDVKSGLAAKQLVGIPWRVAFALQADGWYLRQDIIWHKPNPMPESVTDRCTKAHEYIFLLSKSPRYYFDSKAIQEDAIHAGRKLRVIEVGNKRNKRDVWTVAFKPFKGAHFATFPPKLIEPCILAGSPVGGVVLDPFNGAGTTGVVAKMHGREYIGIELNPAYVQMSEERIGKAA